MIKLMQSYFAGMLFVGVIVLGMLATRFALPIVSYYANAWDTYWYKPSAFDEYLGKRQESQMKQFEEQIARIKEQREEIIDLLNQRK